MVGRHLCLSLYHLCGPSSFFLKYKVCSEQNNSIVPSCSLWFKLSVFLMVSSHLYSWLLLRWLIKSMVHTHTYLLIKWLFSRSLAFSSKHAFSLSLSFFFTICIGWEFSLTPPLVPFGLTTYSICLFPPGGSESKVCNARDPGSIPEWGWSLEKDMATHFSILAWRIPWAEEPGVYSPWGCK